MLKRNRIKNIDEFPRRVRIFVKIIFWLLMGGTLGFKIIDGESFKEAFFRTLQTLAFMFEENPTIAERSLEIFLSIFGVFLVWWVLWSLADMLIDGSLVKYLKTKAYRVRMKELKNHIIVAGGGRVGEEIARILTEKKEKFVVIEINSLIVENLRKKKYLVMEGNAEHDNMLLAAGIKSANKLIITLPKTEANILITLAAKELNPDITIHARAENSKFVPKLKKAGAKIVVIPEVVAGNKLV